VRIGFDMLAVQSPHHGTRGIGRYSASLVASLLARDDGHEYVLYLHDDLPADRVPQGPRAAVRTVRPAWERGEVMSPFMDRLVRANPDRIDAFIVLGPFETRASYTPPARPPEGPKLLAVVYDLIPFLFQNETHPDPGLRGRYHALNTIARYDALLAASEATRRDVLSLLRMPPDRVVNIRGASDPRFFVPDRTKPAPDAVRRTLSGLGIERPFVLNVGGPDPLKNTRRLLEAFAELPGRLRDAHQLLLVFEADHWAREAVRDQARELGVDGSVILTGAVSPEALRTLYQRCEVFVVPSLYEGFGGPLVEAMHCGAAVIGGNNSSQAEVVGDAGLLAEASDTHDIAAKLQAVLDDPALARWLRSRGVGRAAGFWWDHTASLVLDAVARSVGRPATVARRVRVDRGHARKPNIAFFSPLPPRKSGISDYAASLLDELRKTYRIDLFHDAGYVPEPALASPEFTCCDYRQFERLAAAKDYHGVVYQMGNSKYHSYMFPVMLRHPGLVTLHDFCLAGFHLYHGHAHGMGMGFIADELRRWHPEDADEIEEALPRWPSAWEDIERDCARRGWTLNRRVLDAASCVVVHSPWCERQVRDSSPEYADKVVVIPMGGQPRRTTDAQRAAIRDKFNLPLDALLVMSFGYVHPGKMSPEALDAFAAVARDDPKALFVFVGEEVDGGEARRHAAGLGLSDRVRFLGRQSADSYAELVGVADIGVNLRLPPTNGETSAALLNLLASGVPTVVTDVGTFSDFPESVVHKVRWEAEGADGLRRALHGLAADRAAREALGRSAWSHVNEYHEWSRVARLYVEAIERGHEAHGGRDVRGRSRTGCPEPAAGRRRD
jgi:glycosyltransferase involved in cell wall biosynthesis